jgi:hypothetical protein
MEIKHQRSLQVLGENRIRKGYNSKRPNSISADKRIFEMERKPEKLPVGPTIFKPGPILLRQETTAVKFVTISILSTMERSNTEREKKST